MAAQDTAKRGQVPNMNATAETISNPPPQEATLEADVQVRSVGSCGPYMTRS